MDIVLVHLGEEIPQYLHTCIEQIRRFTDKRIILALSHPNKVFSSYKNITVYPVDQQEKTGNWKRYNTINFFKTDRHWGLFKYACERFFIIEAIMRQLKIESVFHIENDNLIYAAPDEEFFKKYCGISIGLPILTETLITAGIMYIGSVESLEILNSELNSLMSMGEGNLYKKYGTELMGEMRLLKIISDKYPEMISFLPTFPSRKYKFVYDPASWGQFIGGTHQDPDKPYTTDNHIIGREIIKGKYTVKWEAGLPYVIDTETKRVQQIFNLHIHSKKLSKWTSNFKTSVSDSTAYSEFLNEIMRNPELLKDFRRDPQYDFVVPGNRKADEVEEFVELIRNEYTEMIDYLPIFEKSQGIFGNPKVGEFEFRGKKFKFDVPIILHIYYLALTIRAFDDLDGMHICEIGPGAGLFFKLVTDLYPKVKYTFVDLKGSLFINKKHVEFLGRENNVEAYISYDSLMKNSVKLPDYHLVISDCAFNELHRDVQKVYIEKILSRSLRGRIAFYEADINAVVPTMSIKDVYDSLNWESKRIQKDLRVPTLYWDESKIRGKYGVHTAASGADEC